MFAVLGASIASGMASPAALAIDIVIQYFDDGNNPSYDPNGTLLRSIFNSAAAMWEDYLPYDQDFEVDVAWTFGTSSAGDAKPYENLAVWSLDTFGDNNIRINNSTPWFIDPTPTNHSEFNFTLQDRDPVGQGQWQYNAGQWLYRDVDDPEQNTWFAGNPPPLMEIGYLGSTSNAAIGDQFDLLTAALHTLGHELGVQVGFNTYEAHSSWVNGEPNVQFLADAVSRHLLAQTALMSDELSRGQRILPSAIDIMAAAHEHPFFFVVDLPRKDFAKTTGSWNTAANWLGGQIPDAGDDVFVRKPTSSGPDASVSLASGAVAGNLHISEGANLDANGFKLDVTSDVTVTGLGSRLFIDAGGELEANKLLVSEGADVNLQSNALIDVNVLELQSNAVLAGRDAGVKTVDVAISLRNDGVIQAENGAELRFVSSSANSLDLDGNTGNGVVQALAGDLTFVTGSLSDAFSGTMRVGADRTITFQFPWESDGAVHLTGGSLIGDSARIAGHIATFNSGEVLVSGIAAIESITNFQGSVHVETLTAASTLHVGSASAPVLLGDCLFEGSGRLNFHGLASIGAGATAVIDVDTFDWDGDVEGTHQTTIGTAGWLNLTGNVIADAYDGDIVNTAGTLNVTTAAWTMNGRIDLNGGGRLIGTARMDLAGPLVVDGVGGTLASPVALKSTASVAVPDSGDELILDGATSYEGGQYRGNGVIRQDGPATVNANTSIGANLAVQLQPGLYQPLWLQKFDWDGTGGGGATTITEGRTLTINAVQIDDVPASDGYDGTVTVNGGTLLINTGPRVVPAPGTNGQTLPAIVAPAPWRLDATMNLAQAGGMPAVVASSTGSAMLIHGIVNATAGASIIQLATLNAGSVNVKSGATLTVQSITVNGGLIDVDAGGALQLSGAALQPATTMTIDGEVRVANATFRGGAYNGAGTIVQGGVASIAETTTINVDMQFPTGGSTTIASGRELRLGRGGSVAAGASISGDNILRNLSASTLLLSDDANLDLTVANQGRTIVGPSSAAQVAIDEYLQAPSGILEVDLGAVGYDAIAASTGFELDGTLEVRLLPGFTAALGQSFQILSGGPVSGAFATELLPSLGGGLALDAVYGSSFVRLNVVAAPSFSANFDGDGDVDGADLGIWKAAFGNNAAGDADGDNDTDGADFLAWQRQLGSALPAVTAVDAVPEPLTAVLVLIGVVAARFVTRRRVSHE